MKNCLIRLSAVLVAVACLLCSAAALEVSARSAILVDLDSGRALYEKDSAQQRSIASITKIMTALVALERCNPGELVTVAHEHTLAEGSSMYLKAGEILPLEELLYGLMLASGNDAALAAAQHCAGDIDVFVGWMNQAAQALGMNDTRFRNPNGLDEAGHYSTAADMAKLAAAAMENEAFARIVSTKTITIGSRTLKNHNKLLWQYDGVLGVKTGYTGQAGRTLVTCACRDGQRLIAVTLCDKNDWADHAALYDYGFAAYPNRTLCTQGSQLARVTVSDGLSETVPVIASESIVYPLSDEETPERRLILPLLMKAPIAQGASAGQVIYTLNGTVIGTSPLVFGRSVDRLPTGLERFWSGVQGFFGG